MLKILPSDDCKVKNCVAPQIITQDFRERFHLGALRETIPDVSGLLTLHQTSGIVSLKAPK